MKRIEFAQKITSGELNLSILQNKTTFSSLHQLLGSFKISIFRNNSLIEFVDNISNGNIRKAVELLKSFFGSGHVNTEKILKIQLDEGNYIVSLHEFLRSVIYGDNVHYNPNSSLICNLLDVHNNDAKEHFLIPLLLGVLHNYMTLSKEHGFVKINEVYTHLQSYGYISDQIDIAIDFCYSKGLIETSEKGNEILINDSELMLRIAPQGAYHVLNLINHFVYLDAIVVDTPIFADETRGKITECYEINERLERVERFLSYLDAEWEKMKLEKSHFHWLKTSNQVRQEIAKIKENSVKRYTGER